MNALLRATRIGRVLLRYRLDDLLDGFSAEPVFRQKSGFRGCGERATGGE